MLDCFSMERESDLALALRQHHLFSGLQQDVFDGLLTQMTARTLSAGEILFHRGDKADSFYFIYSGQLSLAFISETGERKIIEIAGPGTTIAEAVAFMQKTNYPVTTEALEACVVVRVPFRDYIALLHNSPAACMRLLGDICRHLHSRVQDIENLSVQNARYRFTHYLLGQVRGKTEGTAEVELSVPKNVLASRLSIKPETLSRILRSMAEEKVISIASRKITINDIDKLRQPD